MYKKLVLSIFLFCNITACSSLHSKGNSDAIGLYHISAKFNESDDSSTGNRLMAFPFYAIGGAMMGFGGLFLVTADSENSEAESRSEAQNGLLGLGLLAGGAMLWAIGNSIEE